MLLATTDTSLGNRLRIYPVDTGKASKINKWRLPRKSTHIFTKEEETWDLNFQKKEA